MLLLFIYLLTFCDMLTSLIMTVIITDFRSEVAENCVLLSYYAVSSRSFSRTFRDNLSVPFQCSRIQENPFGFLTP